MSEILTISQNYKVDSNYSAVHTIRESKLLEDPKLDFTLTYAVGIFKLSLTVFEKIGNNIYTEIPTYLMSCNSSAYHTIRPNFKIVDTEDMSNPPAKFY